MLIKVRTFPSATVQNMRLFVVLHLKKNPDNIITHIGTNNAPPTMVHMKCLNKYKV